MFDEGSTRPAADLRHGRLLFRHKHHLPMKPYAENRGRGPDFFVKYRLYSASEGGRKVTFQHLRCDFMYAGDDPQKDGIFMIHPEFLDEHNVPIGEDVIIPLTGRASMWILNPVMRVGVRGHFMEGSRKISDVEIDAIAGLHEDPST